MGSLVLEAGFHNQRFELIRSLVELTELQVWGRLSEKDRGSRSKRLASNRLTGSRQQAVARFGRRISYSQRSAH